jgi:hypothetical protein
MTPPTLSGPVRAILLVILLILFIGSISDRKSSPPPAATAAKGDRQATAPAAIKPSPPPAAPRTAGQPSRDLTGSEQAAWRNLRALLGSDPDADHVFEDFRKQGGNIHGRVEAFSAVYRALLGAQAEEEMREREIKRRVEQPHLGTGFVLAVPEDYAKPPHQLQRFKTLYECNEARLLRGAGACINLNPRPPS